MQEHTDVVWVASHEPGAGVAEVRGSAVSHSLRNRRRSASSSASGADKLISVAALVWLGMVS